MPTLVGRFYFEQNISLEILTAQSRPRGSCRRRLHITCSTATSAQGYGDTEVENAILLPDRTESTAAVQAEQPVELTILP